MLTAAGPIKVYLRPGRTDMRKAINGLSALVEHKMNLDPLSGGLFVFCNRRRNQIKMLYWDRNGFCLWQKRLSKHTFVWPSNKKEVLQLDSRQLGWLLEGMDMEQISAHEELKYTLTS